MLEQILQKELDDNLGYDKHSEGHHSGNSPNGRTKKPLEVITVKFELEIPRYRKSEFSPIAVKKHQKSSSFELSQ
ncbi:MAG: transposase [Candidatus Protochlamydia sp.]|nr:transposase [Candidatus Protochlamydia sp.]